MRLPPGVLRPLQQARALSSSSYVAAVSPNPTKRGVNRAKVLLDESGSVRRPLPPLSSSGSPIVSAGREPKKVLPKKSKSAAASSSRRSSKASSSKVTVEDAAEEVAVLEDLDAEVDSNGATAGDDAAAVPTVLETSVRRDLARYPNALLLTQVGSFYETYFDQAPLVARELGIKLTSKTFGRGTSKIRHPFAGFPLSQLSKHVSTLVSNGHRVVIVEEFREPGYNAGSVGEISRRVTRIVTPGTGVDEGFIKKDVMNFVLAIGLVEGVEGEIGLAYRDISTGASFTRLSKFETLRDDLLLVEPKEIVVDEGMEEHSELGRKVLELLKGEEEREAWMISTSPPSPPAASTSTIPPSPESTAEHVLLSYLASTLLSTPPPQTIPIRFDPTKMMQMDSTTLQSLEIRGSLRGGVKGSLLSTVRRTVTPGGCRLLAERLCSPSTELSEIHSRLSLVATFHSSGGTRPYLRLLLKNFVDTSRTLQRLFLRRGNAFDLLHLKRTILGAEDARRVIEDCLDEIDEPRQAALELLAKMDDHTALAEAIELAIDEEALVKRTQMAERRAGIVENLGVGAADKVAEEEANEASKTNGLWGKNEEWVIKAGFSLPLTKLHGELESLRRKADQLEKKLQKKYDTKLQLKVDRKLGPVLYLQVKTEPEKLAQDPSTVLVAKSGSSRTYVVTAWSQLSGKIGEAMARIRELESQTMQLLISRTLENYPSLQKLSDAIDELDVALGFAELARDMDLVRPIVNDGTSLTIVEGRHPTVEHSLKLQGRPFTSNSVHFSHPGAFIHCLTGPNMAGKSTFLRQTALIVILAQAGSFVPAESVTMGIVDRVFSRVGARDELDRDRSTFMVEMDEATSILNNATKRSLVLFDELGRGTSPLDGLAIAYAALEHLLNVNQSRTLFATHYHRLGELVGCDEGGERGTGPWEGIEFWCTDVREEQDSVEYLHTVRRGLNNDSAGIVVARLSGMPERAIRVAQELRARYEGRA